jgi:hypothetical protein
MLEEMRYPTLTPRLPWAHPQCARICKRLSMLRYMPMVLIGGGGRDRTVDLGVMNPTL